jgi:hypothetical protein
MNKHPMRMLSVFSTILFGQLIAITPASSQTQAKFSLQNIQPYDSDISDGNIGLLFEGETFVDTVSAGFGFHSLDDSTIIYYRFETVKRESYKNSGKNWGYLDAYYLYSNGRKLLAQKILHRFNNWFSSPSVIHSKILYWGISRKSNGNESAYHAMKYDHNN